MQPAAPLPSSADVLLSAMNNGTSMTMESAVTLSGGISSVSPGNWSTISINDGSNNSSSISIRNGTLPETPVFVICWWIYFLLLILFSMYCIFVTGQLFKVIYESQKGLIGSIWAIIVALIAAMILLGIGVLLRFLCLFSCHPIIICLMIFIDGGIIVIECIVLCIRHCLCATNAAGQLVFMMAAEIVEVVLLSLMLSDIMRFCADVHFSQDTICFFHPDFVWNKFIQGQGGHGWR